MSIDISTHDLISASCEGLSNVTDDVATQIWHSIAKVLTENLAAKRVSASESKVYI
jgi:hypothetical protein